MNKSLPPIGLYVRNEFLYNLEKGHGEYTYGHLISVRSLQNQALQFSVLLGNGALFTGLPAHSLCFHNEAKPRTLQECQFWDNISNEIDVVCFETLRYMACSVKFWNNEIAEGEYLFTIDYVGTQDFSACSVHWKQLHAIKLDDGNLVLAPQYRVRFLDKAICRDDTGPLPSYNFNDNIWIVGS